MPAHLARWLWLLLYGAAALFYLQFGVQAMFNFIPQGALAIAGAVAIAWAGVRMVRCASWPFLLFWGTLPLLVLHAVMTVIEPGELPFLIGSAPVPMVAGIFWFSGRNRPVMTPA